VLRWLESVEVQAGSFLPWRPTAIPSRYVAIALSDDDGLCGRRESQSFGARLYGCIAFKDWVSVSDQIEVSYLKRFMLNQEKLTEQEESHLLHCKECSLNGWTTLASLETEEKAMKLKVQTDRQVWAAKQLQAPLDHRSLQLGIQSSFLGNQYAPLEYMNHERIATTIAGALDDILSILLVNNMKHSSKRFSNGNGSRPSGKAFRDCVHHCDIPVEICNGDRMSDAFQRRAKPFRVLSWSVADATLERDTKVNIGDCNSLIS
jgi:hypothetical protein